MELLEEIMGVDVIQVADIKNLQKTDPSIVIIIISKIMDFLMYLTRIPAKLVDPNGSSHVGQAKEGIPDRCHGI